MPSGAELAMEITSLMNSPLLSLVSRLSKRLKSKPSYSPFAISVNQTDLSIDSSLPLFTRQLRCLWSPADRMT